MEPALIENAAKLVGMPLGPLQLIDETSIDLGVKIAKATKAAMGDAYPDGAVDEVLFWMVDQGRLGRKSNAGYYAYDDKGKRTGIWEGLRDKYPAAEDQPDLTEVQHRLLFAQVLEAVRALEDGVLMDIREGDVGAILGWGFAPWSGGPFSWLDMIGAAKAVEICDDLTAQHGARFEAPNCCVKWRRRAKPSTGASAIRPKRRNPDARPRGAFHRQPHPHRRGSQPAWLPLPAAGWYSLPSRNAPANR